jgi:predicted phosphoribosyltransferase
MKRTIPNGEERAMIFKNRRDAGRQLAAALHEYEGLDDLLVLALPRGGVPVAYEVAEALQAPLEVFVVRKLGVPGREELAMGAVASGGVHYLDGGMLDALDISQDEVEEVLQRELRELERREQAYRDHRPPPDPEGKTVILIDDGVATGSTMVAGISALKREQPAALVVAVPVAARSTAERLAALADDFVCLHAPETFIAVGQWYEDFDQTTDEQVRELLNQHGHARA